MATPETKVKQKFKRRIAKQAKIYGVEVFCDFPPASQYGSRGRPDIYVDFGSVHFRVETKGHADSKLSPTQEVWHDRHCKGHCGIPLFIIKGEEELELFFENFDENLRMMLGKHISELEKQWHEVE